MFTNINPFPVSKSHLDTDTAYNLIIKTKGLSPMKNKVMLDFENNKPLQNDSFKLITSVESMFSEAEVFIFNLNTRDQAIAICLFLMTTDNFNCVKTNKTTYMEKCSHGNHQMTENSLKEEALNVTLLIGPYSTKKFDIVKKMILKKSRQDEGHCDGKLTIKGSELTTIGKQFIRIISSQELKETGE